MTAPDRRAPVWRAVAGGAGADAAWYAALLVAGLAVYAAGPGSGDPIGGAVVEALLLVLAPSPLLLRRTAPRAALVAAAVLLILTSLLGRDSGVAVTTLAVVLVVGMSHEPRLHPLAAFLLSASAADLSGWLDGRRLGQPVQPSTFVFATFGTGLATGLGLLLRRHRDALAELAARNADLAERNAELDRLRRAAAERAVADERARIARELHDVVAHHVAGIAVRAAAVTHVHRDRHDDAAEALRYVAEAAGETLAALRRMLGLLRADPPDAHPVEPQPDLSSLQQLLARQRAAGQTVTVTTHGTPPALPADAQLAVYRVLQEALTNALRHAPGAPVTVLLHWRTGLLDLRVDNPLPASPVASGGTGHGILGMTERVHLLGGHLTAAPGRGCWRLRADVPLPHTAAAPPEQQEPAALVSP